MSIMHKLFGHHYVARYDDLAPTAETIAEHNRWAIGMGGFISMNSLPQEVYPKLRTRKYVLDICTRCGDVKHKKVTNNV